ncbi:MAG: hypothetical protein ACYTAO_16935 [Planctomycetota bacterium]
MTKHPATAARKAVKISKILRLRFIEDLIHGRVRNSIQEIHEIDHTCITELIHKPGAREHDLQVAKEYFEQAVGLPEGTSEAT